MTPALSPVSSTFSKTTECPEPLCLFRALPSCRITLMVFSVDITPPSSLLWAHAPNQYPPSASVVPRLLGPCRLLPVPAAYWSFPTLSLHSLRRCLVPYPAVSTKCTYPFLPSRLRPHVTRNTFGTRNHPCFVISAESPFSGLQTFVYLQAPTLASPNCVLKGGKH